MYIKYASKNANWFINMVLFDALMLMLLTKLILTSTALDGAFPA
jgi:hypothetical protein